MSATTAGTATAALGECATGRIDVTTMVSESRRIKGLLNVPCDADRFVNS